MSDRNEALMPAGNDLELITSYLNRHLDPDRLEQVRRRLDEDPEFRDFATPMLLTWEVPKHLARHPRPVGELEKHWDEFSKRAGFVHQRRRARKRWLTILAVVLAVGAGSFLAFKKPIRDWYRDKTDFHAVAYATGWIPIGEGREVQMSPATKLRVANREDSSGFLNVRLNAGAARFRIFAADSIAIVPDLRFIAVSTPSGNVAAPTGEFSVTSVADTTDVEVHRPSKRQFIGFMPMPNTVFMYPLNDRNHLTVKEGQRARIVRGSKAKLIP